MKYFIYRLEITDGEHQYYSSGLCKDTSYEAAIQSAGIAAKNWYDHGNTDDITQPDGNPTYEHLGGIIICAVDVVNEIPKSDYDILFKYPSFI